MKNLQPQSDILIYVICLFVLPIFFATDTFCFQMWAPKSKSGADSLFANEDGRKGWLLICYLSMKMGEKVGSWCDAERWDTCVAHMPALFRTSKTKTARQKNDSTHGHGFVSFKQISTRPDSNWLKNYCESMTQCYIPFASTATGSAMFRLGSPLNKKITRKEYTKYVVGRHLAFNSPSAL